MEVELSSLIVAITGIGALVWGIIQSNRSRRDTNQQQLVANELGRREQDWDELRDERANARALREDIERLHAQLRERDNLILYHRQWDMNAFLAHPDLGKPPPLYPE